jgi:hypothetical protein
MEELVSTVKRLFFQRNYKKCASHSLQLLHDHEDEVGFVELV